MIVTLCGCHTSPQNTSWAFTFKEVNGHATLQTDGVTIVFEGEKRDGESAGQLRISGTGTNQVSVGDGDRNLTAIYSKGVNKIRFRQHEFEFRSDGRILSIQQTPIELSSSNIVVTVKKDGTVTTTQK